MLIPDNEVLSLLKRDIIAHIVWLNNEHPLCKPIAASWFSHDKKDWQLSGVYFSNFHIYHVNRDYLKTL